MSGNAFLTYGSASIAPRIGIAAVAELLARIEPQVVTDKYSTFTPLPKNKGEIIKWRRIRPMPVSTGALTEGVTPAPATFGYDTVTTVIQQFGVWVQFTDKIYELHEDRVPQDAQTAIADNIASTKEAIIWGQLIGGTQVFYANGSTVPGINSPIDADLIAAGVNTLKRNYGKKLTPRLAAQSGFNTSPVNSSYVMFGHVDAEYDYRNIDGFVPIEAYNRPISEHEIGKVNEVRILIGPQLMGSLGAGAAVGSTGMRSEDGVNVDVYYSVIVAEGAYGTVGLKGKNAVEMHVEPPKMQTGDPLGQRGFVSAKYWFQALRLNELWMVRLVHAVTALS